MGEGSRHQRNVDRCSCTLRGPDHDKKKKKKKKKKKTEKEKEKEKKRSNQTMVTMTIVMTKIIAIHHKSEMRSITTINLQAGLSLNSGFWFSYRGQCRQRCVLVDTLV